MEHEQMGAWGKYKIGVKSEIKDEIGRAHV